MELNLKTLQINHTENSNYDYYYDKDVYNKNISLWKKNPYIEMMHYYNYFTENSKNYKYILAGGYLFNTIVDYEIPNKNNSDIDIFFYNTSNNDFIAFVTSFSQYLLEKSEDIIFETKFYQKDGNSLYDEFQTAKVYKTI